ncbi:hypothetical protein D3C76_703150 [compost metagenome]
MHAAKDVLTRAGVVVLYEIYGAPNGGLESGVVEAFEEESAVITKDLWFEQHDFGYCKGCYFHWIALKGKARGLEFMMRRAMLGTDVSDTPGSPIPADAGLPSCCS